MTLSSRALEVIASGARQDIEEFLRDTDNLMRRATWSAMSKTGMKPNRFDDLYAEAMVCAWQILDGAANTELQTYEYEAVLFRRLYSKARSAVRTERQRGLAGFSTRVRRNEYLIARQRELEARLGRPATHKEALDYARAQLEESGRDLSKQGMKLSEEDFEIAVTYSRDSVDGGGEEGFEEVFDEDLLKASIIKRAGAHSMTAGFFAREMFGSSMLTPEECQRYLGLSGAATANVQDVLAGALSAAS